MVESLFQRNNLLSLITKPITLFLIGVIRMVQFLLLQPLGCRSVCIRGTLVRPTVRPSVCNARGEASDGRKSTYIDVTLHTEFSFDIIFGRRRREMFHLKIIVCI